MNNDQALYYVLELVRNRLTICNRDKEFDDKFEEAYNVMKQLVDDGKKDFSISGDLQEAINNNSLMTYNKAFKDNGYTIRIIVNKTADSEEEED